MRSVDGVANFALDAIDNDERIPKFDYAGGYVAPTVELDPGDQLQIRYGNLMAPRVRTWRAVTSTKRTCTFTV